MSNVELIRCDNQKIKFILNGEEQELTRQYVEKELKIYWFAGNLLELIVRKIIKNERKRTTN